MKKKTITAIGLIGLFILILFMIKVYLNNESEGKAELADLTAMYDAELAARITWKNKTPEQPVEYWFDANQFKLISADEPKPPACGLGTARRGGGIVSFKAQHGESYAYDESEDYRDKVIYVRASVVDGNLDVAVDWVKAD